MKQARFLKNTSGFSLVELMVVVAIIGILATVAIPSVNKYMAKARQTEAKTNLASLYSANKAFSVEYNGFGTHFGIIGYSPEGQMRYNVGFATPSTYPGYYNSLGWTGSLTNTLSAAQGYCGTTSMSNNCQMLVEASGMTLPGSSATNTNFVAGAASSLIKGATLTDQWTIDQAKVVRNVQTPL